MPSFLRVLRVLRLAVRLLIGEFRRDPWSILNIVRRGLRSLFGRSTLEHDGKSAVVESVLQAESYASKGRMGRRFRRTFGDSFFTQFGLGLVRAGHVSDAAWLLQSTADRNPEHVRVAAAATVVEGERRVLSGEWTSPGDLWGIESKSGTVLHIVGKSLPHTVAGYTIRTQSIVGAQRTMGLNPEVVTRIGFPYYVDGVPEGDVEHVDGIPYHRIGGPEVPPRWDDRLTANVEALLPIVEQVRPAVIHAHSDFENALLALALRDRFEIPVVYEVRGFWEETWLSGSPERRPNADRFRLRHQREVACAKAADRVVTL
ncbi:MAG: glycosyltransferase, partial [Acidimicrobiia bacterium]|nr:glycosyltransferase [Acidimicrobiia bacterium]